MTSGPCQEISFSAITLNPESNFTRREKNHSVFHWNTLTSPELLRQTWMLCKNAASMTIGTSMDHRCVWFLDRFQSVYSIHETPPDGHMWSSGRLTNGKRHAGQNSGEDCQRTPCEGEKQKMGNWKTNAGYSRRVRVIYFIDPEDIEFKEINNARKNWKHQWF